MNQSYDYHARYDKALELDKILALLAKEAGCEDAAELALRQRPSRDLRGVEGMLAHTSDAFLLLSRFGRPSISGIHNVDGVLKRAQIGASLSMGELLAVANVMRVIRGVKQWRSHCEGVSTSLDEMFGSLHPTADIETRITSSILSPEEMADSASAQLQDIRRKIARASLKAKERLDGIVHSPQYQKYLQESIVTMRDGRYVVPVKAEHKNEIKGLVHDTSGSGATLFIEPMGVVEANNEVRVLKSQEQEEIDRILAELTALVDTVGQSVKMDYYTLVELDLIFAKANLGANMRSIIPKVNGEGRVVLRKARHPLIDPKRIVPTDINLGVDFDTLVITGPNTGGKTVSIKTLGLFCLMAMCGLMIPASDQSEVAVFDKVLADIGDEQSIEQSLSTFSGHMTNIVSILKEADRRTLVLIDELGAGTDPVEGAALAISILEELAKKGAKVAATTHYAELKVYALETDGVENGSCEFDIETLSPTYRLLIGVPGRSNAFAISRRLGLEGRIVTRAQSLMDSENKRFEDVVERLEGSRQALEAEREEVRRLREEADGIKAQAEERLAQAQAQYEEEIAKARRDAVRLVNDVKYESQQLIDELTELRRQKDEEAFSEMAGRAKNQLRSRLTKLEDLADPVTGKRRTAVENARAIKKGDTVEIIDIDKKGTALEDQGDKDQILVQAGIFKTRVPVQNLRLLESEKIQVEGKRRRVTTSLPSKKEMQVKSEINLMGQTVDEALLELDQFIDHCVLSGVNLITIVHGKGTGALRSAVSQHLRKHPSIRSFRLGVYGEGESGVTIAEIKS